MTKNFIVAIAVVFTFINAMVVQQWRIADLTDQLRIAEMRADVNTDFANELVYLRVNDIHDSTKDQLVAQGRVEGVVSYLQGGQKEVIQDLWHQGYTHGLEQVDYQQDAITEAGFLRGYKAAVHEIFPTGKYPKSVSFQPTKEEAEGSQQTIDALRKKLMEAVDNE